MFPVYPHYKDQTMPKNLIEITSEIVQTQVSLTPMTAADITSSLRQVFRTLYELQEAETAGNNLELDQPAAGISQEAAPEQKPMLTPLDSIQDDKVICLECGAEMRQLTPKHLVFHGMNTKEYKKKYGFTMRTPLAARSLTKARSKIAKKRGLPENLKKFHEEKKLQKAVASAKTVPASLSPVKPRQTRLRKKKPV
jgi:predicted transcriptional regulator